MTNIPGYWMNESSGVLRPVVEKYLRGVPLSREEVGTMRAYLRQWMRGGFIGPRIERLRLEADAIETEADVADFLSHALDEGIDPL